MLWAATSLSAQEETLVDRALFFDDPAVVDVKISPDGQWLAFRAPHEGTAQLWLAGLQAGVDSGVRVSDGPAQSFVWSTDSEHLLFLRDRDGDENYHLYAVPADTIGSAAPRDLTPYGAIQARIYSLPRSAPGIVVVGLNDRDPQAHDVYRIDIASGARELVLRNDAEVSDWVTDLDGNVRIGVRYGPDGGVEFIRVAGDSINVIFGCAPHETCTPVRFHRDGRRLYLATNRGDRDLTELVLLHPVSFEEEPVDRDPEGRVDFGDAVFSPASDALVATVYYDDTTRIYMQDSVFGRDLDRLAQDLSFSALALNSATDNGALWIVHVESDSDPGSAYLFHRWNSTVDLIVEERSGLPRERLATTTWIRYQARDGDQVPALLTLPPGDSAAGLPAVLLPHHDPWTPDRWGFDPLVQFLASRGYAVLQPNFRGSRGYGKLYVSVANDTARTELLQQDMADGARYLVNSGIADPNRIGIVGFGFGGYAVLAALASTPDLFAAGVAIGAITDLPAFLDGLPSYDTFGRPRWTRRLGDPQVPEELARLQKQSPARTANRITAPVLLAHGINDPRVSSDQSERMVAALRAVGNGPDYLRIAGEGRHLRRAATRIAFAAVLERFLALHLGGSVQDSIVPAVAVLINAMTVGSGDVLGPAAVAFTAPLPLADGSRIQSATLVYRVTTSEGNETEIVRSIEIASTGGRDIWRTIDSAMVPVYEVVEFDAANFADPNFDFPEPVASGDLSPAADTVEVDRHTLLPIQRRIGGQVTFFINYHQDSVVGEFEVAGFIDDITVLLEAPVFADGAGLDLVIAGLPLAEGYETLLRVFDAQLRQVVPLSLTVTGLESVQTPAGTFDVFQITLTPIGVRDARPRSLQVRQQPPHYVVRDITSFRGENGDVVQTSELVRLR